MGTKSVQRSGALSRVAVLRGALLAAIVFVSLAGAQDGAGHGASRTLKHPRGDLWLLVPPGWTGSAEGGASSRLQLAAASGRLSTTIVAFPRERGDSEIFDAVRERFGRLASEGGATGIAWETSALAVSSAPAFRASARGASFAREGHPLRLEVYLLRGADAVFACAVVGEPRAFERERGVLRSLIADARASEVEAAAVASASVASVGSLVETADRRLRLRVPQDFEVEVVRTHLLLHAPSGTVTLLAAHRATSLEPKDFLGQIRDQYAREIASQLGVPATALAWDKDEPFEAGPREGIRARLLVRVPRDGGKPPLELEQRFYVIPCNTGMFFLTGSAPAASRELALFDGIAASAQPGD